MSVLVVVFIAALFAGGFLYVLWDLDELMAKLDRDEWIDALWADDAELRAA